VAGSKPAEQILTKPPFLCIEILSPEDRMRRIQQKIDDYLDFGAEYALGDTRGKVSRRHVMACCGRQNPEITEPLNEVMA
jgi:Uma2 family endonuclease